MHCVVKSQRLSVEVKCSIFAGNKPHPSVSHEQKHHFNEDDPRAALVLPKVDPRIHFALVCGAQVITLTNNVPSPECVALLVLSSHPSIH